MKLYRIIHGSNAHADLAHILNNLGDTIDDSKEKLELYEGALQIIRVTESPLDVAYSLKKRVGQTFIELDLFDKALECFQEALEIAKNSNDDALIADSLGYVGDALLCFDRPEEAQETFSLALNMLPASTAPSTLAVFFNRLGKALRELGLSDEAMDNFRQALEIHTKLHGSTNHQDTTVSLNNIGLTFLDQGQSQEALIYLKKTLEMRKAVHPTPHVMLAKSYQEMGSVLQNLCRFKEALEFYREDLEMTKKLHGSTNHTGVAAALGRISLIYNHLRRFDEALKYSHEALEIRRSVFGSTNHVDLAFSLNNVGMDLFNLGRYQEGMKYLQECVKVSKVIDSLATPAFLSNYAQSLGALGKFKEALSLIKQALSMRSYSYNKLLRKANFLNEMGICLFSLGNFQEALDVGQEALDIRKKHLHENDVKLASSLRIIAKCHAALGNPAQAIEIQKQAICIRANIFGNDYYDVSSAFNISLYLADLGKFEEALKICQNVLAREEKVYQSKHPFIILYKSCIDSFQSLISNSVETDTELKHSLSLSDFQELVVYARSYLQKQDIDAIAIKTNPSGFIRIHLPVPERFSDKIEILRLNYWSPEIKIETVEALHNHPRNFSSMVIHGGYTHAIYKRSETHPSSKPHRVHRILKSPDYNDPDKRNIFCMGTLNLEYIDTVTVEKNSIINFPRSLVHQVLKAIPTTLTINCIFKGQKDIAFFDVYMPPESRADPLVEREIVTEGADKIVAEIKAILQNI